MSATDTVASRKRPGDTRNEPAAKQKNSKPSAIDHAAVIKGITRKLRFYNPMTINRNLYNVLGGNYKDIKVLPSGDLFVNCQNRDQLTRLLQCKNLGDHGGNKIEVSVELYKVKAPETKGVITDVPLELSDDEIKAELANLHVCFVKRFPYHSSEGKKPSHSVLICFNSNVLPSTVKIGYMVFKTRPYTPAPFRCFKCHRYGHKAKFCRGSLTCAKCGLRHEYAECNSTRLKCINCQGAHSAGYAGCPRRKMESRIQALMVKEKLNYWDARAKIMKQQNEQLLPASYNSNFPALPGPCPQTTHSGTPIDLSIDVEQSTSDNTGDNRIKKVVKPGTPSNNSLLSPQESDMTISTDNFFSFIVEVIKNTILSFGQGQSIDIGNIIANSAGPHLDIPTNVLRAHLTTTNEPTSFNGALDLRRSGTNQGKNQNMDTCPLDLSSADNARTGNEQQK